MPRGENDSGLVLSKSADPETRMEQGDGPEMLYARMADPEVVQDGPSGTQDDRRTLYLGEALV